MAKLEQSNNPVVYRKAEAWGDGEGGGTIGQSAALEISLDSK